MFLIDLTEGDLLFLQELQLFLALEDQLADPRELDAVADAEEDAGHHSAIVVGQFRGYQVGADRKSEQPQDEEVDAVVPALSKCFSAFREVSE